MNERWLSFSCDVIWADNVARIRTLNAKHDVFLHHFSFLIFISFIFFTKRRTVVSFTKLRHVCSHSKFPKNNNNKCSRQNSIEYKIFLPLTVCSSRLYYYINCPPYIPSSRTISSVIPGVRILVSIRIIVVVKVQPFKEIVFRERKPFFTSRQS